MRTPVEPNSSRAPSPSRGLVRLLRVAALGGGSLLLAGAAHLAGGGRSPSLVVLAVAAVLLGLSAVTLTARRCRFEVLLAALTVQQVLLHLLFDAAASVTPGCGVTSMSGMGHALAVQACDTPAAMAAMTMPGWSMWAAHLAAVALTAWLLARGETWLWRAAEQIVRAAGAAPSGRPALEPASVLTHRSIQAPTHRPHRTAAPRAPPAILAVS